MRITEALLSQAAKDSFDKRRVPITEAVVAYFQEEARRQRKSRLDYLKSMSSSKFP